MKKNIQIEINSKTSMVTFCDRVIGVNRENLQGNLIFKFEDEFVDGVPRIEVEKDGNKYIIVEVEKVDETYVMPIKSSLLTTENLKLQLVLTENEEEDSIPIFKSKTFVMKVLESINAETEIPEEYESWLDRANEKLVEIDEKIEETENLNVEGQRVDDGVEITFTRKDGTQHTEKVNDGQGGGTGTTDFEGLTNRPKYNGNTMNRNTDIPLIPTKTSDLENDSEFVTSSYHDNTKQDIIEDLDEIREGAELGATAVQDNNYIHTDNNYTTTEKIKLASLQNYDDTTINERITNVENEIDELDTEKADKTEIPDVSEFITNSVNNLLYYYTKNETDTLLNGKVNIVQGKGLSTNDYTTEEKTKLEELENYNDTEIWNTIEEQGQELQNVESDIDELQSDVENIDINKQDKTDNELQTTSKQVVGAINEVNTKANTNSTDIDNIEAKIPVQASASNQLGDKNFINSSIATNTGYYISNNGEPFTSLAQLQAYTGTVTNNDYAFITGTDSEGNTYYDRYKATVTESMVSWAKEFRLNNSSFTANQWDAIQSGITAALVEQISTNTGDIEGIKNGQSINSFSGVETALNNKVDKITGKGLSTNDYTTAEKQKLANLENYNDTEIRQDIQDLENAKQNKITTSNKLSSSLIDDTNATNKFVTSAEKTNWNNKSNFSGNYNDLTNKPTIPTQVTESTVSGWGFTKNTGTYSKPSSGIPKTDLANVIQTSLSKADTALQQHQDITGKEDKTNKVTSISSISTDTQYPSAKCVYDNIINKSTEIKDIIVSRGEQLVINGSAYLGDNTNFSDLIYDGTQTNGSNGSFTRTDKVYKAGIYSDNSFPINPSLTYNFEFDMKSIDNTATFYTYLEMFDIDGYTITAPTHMHYVDTTTTLTQDLKNGDTVIHLNDLSNWHNYSQTYRKGFIAWNYVNSKGYKYPPNTYSKNYYPDLYDDFSSIDKVNKTITLRQPWSNGTIIAGTSISQCNSGGNHKYQGLNNQPVPTQWTTIKGSYSGIDYSGTNKSNMFSPGTAVCKFGINWNANSSQTDQVWLTNISVRSDLSSDKEKLINKTTMLSQSSTDIEYPSAKAVYDLFTSIVDGNEVGY